MENDLSSSACLHLEKVNKYFGLFQALFDITLTVPSGACVGFLGPNGAGKSTLINIIAGIIPLSSGRLKILGKEYSNDTAKNISIKKEVGYLPELPTIYPELRVKDILKFVANIKKVPEVQNEVERVIKLCDLEKVYRSKMGEISKGFKRRVGLAQTLIGSPHLLILDEVTSGMDPYQRRQAHEVLKGEVSAGKTVLFSSHSIEDTLELADRIVIISDGKIAKDVILEADVNQRMTLKPEIMHYFAF